MSWPKCPQTETARPKCPVTETARPKSPVPINSNVDSARISVRIVWICLGAELVRSTHSWKVSFWGWEENSVWILKWTTLLGIFCKISFTPAVTSCYQVHALNADAHLSAALCYFRCHWCRKLAAVNCIRHLNNPHPIHAADGHYTRYSSCITLLWLHHNHKMPISYYKNGFVSCHQSVGRWLIFVFCSKNI